MTHRTASLVLTGLVALGLWLASAAALREAPGPGGVDILELARVLERERAVSIVGFERGDERHLRAAWSERGVGATLSDGAPRISFVAAGEALASELLARAALEVELARDAVTITCEDPERPRVPSTCVIGAAETDAVGAAIDALARALPPTRPRLRLYTARGLRLELDLLPSGEPAATEPVLIELVAPPAMDSRADTDTGTLLSVEVGCPAGSSELARRVAAAVARVTRDVRGAESRSIAEVRLVRSIEARSVDGAVDEAAWYEAHRGRLVGVAGVRDVEFDLVRTYVAWLFHDQFGGPAEAWLAEGIVEVVVRRALEIPQDNASQAAHADLTWDEAVGVEPRARAARLRVRQRLVDFLDLERASLGRTWADGLTDSALARLRAAWDAGDFLTPNTMGDARQPRPLPRPLPHTVAVRLAGEAPRSMGLGTQHTREQLERIAGLGFGAVVLNLRVPLAPPRNDADPGRALDLVSWGRGVTLEGDGAVLATARHARELGLEVVFWPRFVAGPNGPLATQQIHPSGRAFEVLSRRYVLAVEGVAHLAERADAGALVLFEPALFPLSSSVDPAVRAARRSLRRQAIAFARPFHGRLLAFAAGVSQLERASEVADLSTGISFGFELGVLGDVAGEPTGAFRHRLKVASAAAAGRLEAVDVRLDGDDPGRRDALLRATSKVVAEDAGIELVILSYWALGSDRDQGGTPRNGAAPADAVSGDVSVVPENVLRAFASARR